MAELKRILFLECGCRQKCFCGAVDNGRHYCYGEHFDAMAVKGIEAVA